MGFVIKPAAQAQVFARVALNGPAGSGKTYSSLLLARGLVGDAGRIVVIDTEASSSGAYKALTKYDVLDFGAPYEPRRYVEALKMCEDAKYDAVVVDSLSHAWAGEGGCLDTQGAIADSGKGNSYTAWRKVTPEHNRLVETMLGLRAHVIATMRVKTAYELVEDERGKKAPKKMGLAPVQREGMDYEFTVVWDVDVNHSAVASKDRTSCFDGKTARIDLRTGRTLAEWLKGGEAPKMEIRVDEAPAAQAVPEVRDPDVAETLKRLWNDCVAHYGSKDAAKPPVRAALDGKTFDQCGPEEVAKLADLVKGWKA